MKRIKRRVESWRWALPPKVKAPPDELLAQVDIYGETVVLRLYENGVVTTRPVSALTPSWPWPRRSPPSRPTLRWCGGTDDTHLSVPHQEASSAHVEYSAVPDTVVDMHSHGYMGPGSVLRTPPPTRASG